MVKPLGVDTSLDGVPLDTSLGSSPSPVDVPSPNFFEAPSGGIEFGVAATSDAPEGLPMPDVKASGGRAAAIAEARKYLGVPYVFGGTSPKGFDCSGLTQWALRVAGVRLPRLSYKQAVFGKRVSVNDLQPGDLVAWDNSSRNNGADHVALYIGNGEVIVAPKSGDHVKIQKIWGTPWGVHITYPGE